MLNKYLIYSLLLLIVVACSNPRTTNSIEPIENSRSLGFEICLIEDGYKLIVKDPYQGSNGNEFTYILKTSNCDKGDIKIPVSKVVCMSTSHIAFIDAIGQANSICGVSGSDFVYNAFVSDNIEEKQIFDVGYGEYMNAELLISLNPDVVFAYGIDRQSLAPFEKIESIGIPVVYVGDYLENHPLGRLEWIRFFSCFFDELELAENIYDSVSKNYEDLSKLTANVDSKPTVLTGMPWQGIWYVPGGSAFLSNMIEDAGGNYIFSDNDKHESIPLSIEHVFNSANKSQVWIHPNKCTSKAEILSSDDRFLHFDPLKKANIFNNIKRLNSRGGNDYWESGVVNPDVLLKDLISIFHPDIFDNYETVYYLEVNE